MKYSRQKIKDIFYSGSHSFRFDRQLIADVHFLLENKLLFVSKEKVISVNTYYDFIEEIKDGKIPVIDIDGGQVGHMALKLVGRDYLVNKGFKDIRFESNFAGYKPDVIANDKKIIIECGNTNPDKIFNYFKNSGLEKFIVITYPDADDKDIYSYTFTPSDKLSDFLLFKEKTELKKIRNISK